MALVRFGLITRMAEREGTTPDIIAKREEINLRCKYKYFQGENWISDDSMIHKLGNNPIIRMSTLYIG